MFAGIKQHLFSIVLAAAVISGCYIAYDHYTDVKKDLAAAIAEKDRVSSELNELKKEIKLNDELEEKKKAENNSLKKEIETVKQEQSAAKKEIDAKIAAIAARYKLLPDTESNRKAQEMEYSLERVRGAWAIYCIQVPTDAVCK